MSLLIIQLKPIKNLVKLHLEHQQRPYRKGDFLSFSFHPHLENNHRNGENKFLEMFKKKDEEKEEETFLSLSLKCSFIFFFYQISSPPPPSRFLFGFSFFSRFFFLSKERKKTQFRMRFSDCFFSQFH